MQSSTITLAQSDEPYMQKYGTLWEPQFHALEHESKMRLLETHFHTSERQGYEADKGRQKERKKGKPSLKGPE